MRTADVRIDPKLNQFIWSQGIRNLPNRVRVRISRKRNEEEGNTKGEFYSLVQHVHVEDFASRLTEKAKVSAWWHTYLTFLLIQIRIKFCKADYWYMKMTN